MAEKKEHVDEAGFCKHCLSTVDGDGYAIAEQENLTPLEGEQTEQQASTEAMRDNSGASFADAARNYAEGGEVKRPLSEEEKSAMARPGFNDESMKERDRESDAYYAEMKKKKAARYGAPARGAR
jgi:hypothetical protein